MADNLKDAQKILQLLGLPVAQLNERTALCLLALIDLSPQKSWKKAAKPLMGITPIMDWISKNYGKSYAPNTRETIRKHSLHIFVDAGIAVANPDKPERPINSPQWVYQIEPNTLELLRTFRTRDWTLQLASYLGERTTLLAKYANQRQMNRIPIQHRHDLKVSLSAGAHSDLIRAIIEDFGANFVPNGELVYVGDTGAKWAIFEEDLLSSLGVKVKNHGIMPDVVIYCRKRNWLILAEAVASSGPVDGKRHADLKKLFKNSKAGLVFVTAFPNQKLMRQYICDIAWETEVWRADAPTHLIHFNGERFLGPY